MPMELDDPEDVFESSLHALFDEAPVAFGSAGLQWTFHPPGETNTGPRRPITLRLPSPAASCTSLQAHHVWSASTYFADLVCRGELDVKGKAVVELGAGGGLGSVVVGRMGAREVLATDYPDEDILATLRLNLDQNLSDQPGCQYAVQGLAWGTRLPGQSFDLVLALDLLWQSSYHDVLLDSIFASLASNGRCIIVSGFHSGRHVVAGFVERVKARRGVIERWREVRKTVDGFVEVPTPCPGADDTPDELRKRLVYFEVVLVA